MTNDNLTHSEDPCPACVGCGIVAADTCDACDGCGLLALLQMLADDNPRARWIVPNAAEAERLWRDIRDPEDEEMFPAHARGRAYWNAMAGDERAALFTDWREASDAQRIAWRRMNRAYSRQAAAIIPGGLR